MKRTILVLLSAIVVMPVAAAAEGPSGRAMAETCYVCHGPAGRSVAAVPPLARLPRELIVHQMREFAADRRAGTIMNRIARGYSEDELAAIADYLATLK